MALFTFSGTSIYFKHTPETELALRALAEAIPQVRSFITGDRPGDDFTPFAKIMCSQPFQLIKDNNEMFTPDRTTFPRSTPGDCLHVNLETKEIQGELISRLYIPVVASYGSAVKTMTEGYLPFILIEMFSKDLRAVKTKTALSLEKFEEAIGTTLYAPEREVSRLFKLH